MDPTLKTVLFAFFFYSLMCLLPLWGSFRSNSRAELMVNGVYLIILASFVLTGVALVSGAAESLTGKQTLSAKESEDLSDFMQYIIFGGTIVTLLFGSVGANVFCSGLLQNNNQEILRRLDQIEEKIDNIHKPVLNAKSSFWFWFWFWRIAAVVGAIVILSWAW